ncbi:MAG TPA: sarcosine oxidase subunit gamma family protein [Stellaceae bacterium]|nr:sarcosine oxidase subunit gamma family protein [Stellaceae bacterium]
MSGAAAIVRLPRRGRFIFRGRADALKAAGVAYGVALPRQACRAAFAGSRAALWLGPDEWLLLLPEGEAENCAAALTRALAGLPHSLVDVGHRQVGLEIAGPPAATVLNAGCPLDLDGAVFPVGMCTRTVLGKAEIVLWRVAEQCFRIEVAQSFAAYVLGLLNEALREFATGGG